MIIAIDGPAASGKSTTARLVAARLGYLHIDTGAMYRAITLKALEEKVDLHNQASVAALVETTEVRLKNDNNRIFVFLDNRDVTAQIRSREVTKAVSEVSSISAVRDLMVREQRAMGKSGGIVLEGRDIGTVVFPNADLKFYLVAEVRQRAKRRQRDLETQGINIELEELTKDIEQRDNFDSNREISPLKKAEDAILLDTSNLTVEEQVEFIVQQVQQKMESQTVLHQE